MPRVLLVEDDPTLRDLIEVFCEEEGYRVDAVGSVDEAVARLRSGGFDLVLRDSISATAEQFYTSTDPMLASVSHPPVVVVSAHSLDTTRVESLGYAALVLKPFDIDVLGDVMRRLLGLAP